MSIDSFTETAIFERIVLPQEPAMSEQAAKSILGMRFSEDDRRRMDVLAEKARQGTLTAEESQEIENFERVGHYLSILHSKARLALRGESES